MQVNVRRKTGGEALPRHTVIGGLEQVWPHVVQSMRINDHVSRAGFKRRWLDASDRAPLRHTGDIRGDVGPVLASVVAHMHQAVVAAGAAESVLLGRLGMGN